MKYFNKYALLLTLFLGTSCGQNKSEEKKNILNSETKGVITSHGPKSITRKIIQGRMGSIWMAAFDGIFRYDPNRTDGKSFDNITSKLSSARFFSVLEDRKGNMWFGSIGSGVFLYDGKSFTNFTTKEGLLNNEVGSIYEDKKGNIWFGVSGGTSRYDPRTAIVKSFTNYIADENGMHEDRTGKTFPNRQRNGVSTIIEDKKGNLWFGAGGVFRYDGRSFTSFTHGSKPFKNVRSIIEDRKGNIWIGGAEGLWRYDGSTLTQFNQRFVGDIMEDKTGNIWISSGRNSYQGWTLSRYEEKSLSDKYPTATTIVNKPMIFGILEDDKGNIWFGDFDGVHRYDGKTIMDFKGKEEPK